MSEDEQFDQYERLFCDPRTGEGCLQPGMSGAAARNLRIALRALGYSLDFTDQYDDALAKTILEFQTRQNHSSQDGLCGRGTRRLLVQAVLEKRGPLTFRRMAEPRMADTEGTKDLREFQQKVPTLAKDLQSLEKLLGMDVPSALNKIRFIAEKVLYGACASNKVSWGQAEPTLERMLGPLVAAGCVPKSAAIHVRIVQLVASPGSHFQESELSQAHVEIALLGLVGLLEWHAANVPAIPLPVLSGSDLPPPPPPIISR